MGPLEKKAVIESIAKILSDSGEIHEREIDSIGLVEGEDGVIGIELEDGTDFFLKIEAA